MHTLLLLLHLIGFQNWQKPANTYYLSNFKIKCITTSEIGSDEIYIKLNPTCCATKKSNTYSFQNNVTKTLTEVQSGSGFAFASNWCLCINEKIKIYEEDVFGDDLIGEITINSNTPLNQTNTVTKVFGNGRYEISYRVVKL